MGFFDKLKKITSNLFSGFTEADEDFFEELEETLIMADLGVDAATDAVEKLRTKVRKEHLQSQEAVREGLREILMAEMEVGDTAMKLDTKPSVCIFTSPPRPAFTSAHADMMPVQTLLDLGAVASRMAACAKGSCASGRPSCIAVSTQDFTMVMAWG